MEKIAFVGKGDKRIFVYPLLHVCKYAGSTCVITDDVSYRRLFNGYDTTDTIEDIEINIIPTVTKKNKKNLESWIFNKDKEGFDYCIFIIDGVLLDGMDKTIAICSQTKTFLGWDMEEFSDKNPEVTIATISMFGVNKKGSKDVKINYFTWKVEYFQYLCQVEEFKKLLAFKDKSISQFLNREFHDMLKVTPSTFSQLISKR